MNLDNVETMYPLSPAQAGILFHSLSDPDSFAYFGQLGFTFFRGFDDAAFERAWQRVIERHAVLRTFFVWEGLKEPVQVVQNQTHCSIERQDWRHLSDLEQAEQMEQFLQSDRRKKLDLAKAPLMRLTLIRTGEDAYRFIWSHHHILLDGWSAPCLLNELLALYAAFRERRELTLPAIRPYRDYVVWISKQNVAEAESYWRTLLKDFQTPIFLGVERKPLSQTKEGEPVATGSWEEQVEVGAKIVDRLQELARARRVTLNTILQGAWSVLMSKYSGATDVVYGATVSGRPPELQGVEDMVGLFINTLPVRVQVQPDVSVTELLRTIQEQQVETRQYEYSRLVDVQTWSGIRRGTQLFNSIFVFENYPVREAGEAGEAQLNVGGLFFHQRTNYPLTVAASVGNSMNVRALFDARWYSRDTVRQILQHLVNIVEAIATTPDQRIGDLGIVTGAERTRLLKDWNQTQTPWQADKTLVQLFEDQVNQRGDSLALISKKERLTYKELDERSNQLAHYLQKKGVGPEVIVGLCLERSVSLVVALLGILKAGGAYLPLDGGYPKSRLNFMLQDSNASVIVTNGNYADQFEFGLDEISAGCELVHLDKRAKEIADQPTGRVMSNAVSENLAYVIYTSGSTGQPKGVMVQHKSISNLGQAMARRYEMTAQSHVLQFASISFDASVSEIFTALLAGAQLHIAGTESLRPGADLIELLRSREISVVTLPPSVLGVLSADGLPHLKTVVSAGEACSPEMIERWSNGRRFINAYGPTETTVCASMSMPLQKDDPVVIGKPIENGDIYILDSNLQPAPSGVAGELYVGGDVLGRGYCNRPDLTAERFVPEPFSGRPGARMYRTGDLARYYPDGNIEYLRRMDQQQKIRGFRIEPGEVEAALEQHPKISKAVVVVREDAPGDKRLVAYILAQSGQTVTSRELQHVLRLNLPDFMVPSAFVLMEAFPLTPNGKVDRGALPPPGSNRVESGDDYVAPRNQAEQIIARIWCDVLQLEKVGVHDNFFDLGGQSLLMLQVHGKLKEAFDKELTMLQMFGYPTVSALAEYFTQSPRQEPKSHFRNIQERANKRREALKQQALRRQDPVASTRP